MEQNFSNKKGVEKLADELKKFSSSKGMDFLEENDAGLSLMVGETLNGIDIRKEYPSFYNSLTNNEDLRQRFIDAISFEDPELIASFKVKQNIKQLQTALSESAAKIIKKWQLSIADLTSVFFARQKLAFRGNSENSPHYILLNEEIELQPVVYSLMVEGMLSDEPDKLTLEVDLTISESNERGIAALPVYLDLTWGAYSKHLTLDIEGVFTLTEVPLSAFLNADYTQVDAVMELSLSRPQ